MALSPGASVIRKDKTIAKITGFNGEFVLLSTKDGPLKTSYKSFLNHEWGTFKAKNAVEFLTDLEKISFMKSEKGKIEYIKAAIQCEVWTMARQETGLHWLQMSTKPKNVIVGPTDIAKGKLRLYPCTWQVVQKAKGASPSANVVLGEYLQGFWIFISSCVVQWDGCCGHPLLACVLQPWSKHGKHGAQGHRQSHPMDWKPCWHEDQDPFHDQHHSTCCRYRFVHLQGKAQQDCSSPGSTRASAQTIEGEACGMISCLV